MNILIVNPMELFATAAVGDGFINGFSQLGHNVYQFRTGEFYQAKKGLLDLFQKQSNTIVNIQPQDLALEGFFDFVLLYDIDMVFVVRGLIPPVLYLQKLKKLGITTVLYSTEDPYDYETTSKFADYYDFVISNDQIGEQLYKNCKWVPVAANETIYKPLINSTIKYYDLCFVGTFFKERAEFFEKCIDLLKDLKVYFAGHWVSDEGSNETGMQFGKFGLPKEHPIRKMLGVNEGIITSPVKVNILYNNSKIVPCPHRDKGWLGNNSALPANNVSPRLFETACAKAFQLVSGDRKNVIRKFFTDKEMITYDSPQDFMEKTKYYLENEDERSKVIERAYIKVLNNHTYRNRAEQITDFIKRGKS